MKDKTERSNENDGLRLGIVSNWLQLVLIAVITGVSSGIIAGIILACC